MNYKFDNSVEEISRTYIGSLIINVMEKLRLSALLRRQLTSPHTNLIEACRSKMKHGDVKSSFFVAVIQLCGCILIVMGSLLLPNYVWRAFTLLSTSNLLNFQFCFMRFILSYENSFYINAIHMESTMLLQIFTLSNGVYCPHFPCLIIFVYA